MLRRTPCVFGVFIYLGKRSREGRWALSHEWARNQRMVDAFLDGFALFTAILA